MSSWDSEFKTSLKIKVDGKPVQVFYRVVYDTPHYVCLYACVSASEVARLGYVEPDEPLYLDSASRESSRIDARSMNDIDVFDLLGDKLRKLDRYCKTGLKRIDLEKMMRKQGLETTRPARKSTLASSSKLSRYSANSTSKQVRRFVVRRYDDLYLRENGRWSKNKAKAKVFTDEYVASSAAFYALPKRLNERLVEAFGRKTYEVQVVQ